MFPWLVTFGNPDLTVFLADGSVRSEGKGNNLFVGTAGIVEFIQKIRMETAADLLENSNLSISQISEQLGFSSPSYFSTRFKNFTGKTPGQFR